MPEPFLMPAPTARHALPLQGLTMLAVEDSRFASDALRLMCQRSGARLRRAETLRAAQAHLRVYRPDVVLIDLSLPDGRGEGLIRTLALSPSPPVVLGTSGDPAGRVAALAAGATGFLEKPFESLAAFQNALLAHLPDRFLHRAEAEGTVTPDPLALRDDLATAARLIDAGPDAPARRFVTSFVRGLAHSAHDLQLAQAAAEAEDAPGLARLSGLLHRRLSETPAFR